jgi:hypothetical protein
MTSTELYDLIALPGPVRERFEQWDAEDASVMDPALEGRLLRRDEWEGAYRELAARLGEADQDHVRLLWEELRVAVRRWPRWEQAGIPLEIYRDTMAFGTRYLKDGLAAYGHYCFTAGWWFPRQLAMELFRLGSLEFELVREEGVPGIYLHIPTDASLAPEAIDDSFRRVRDFTARFYPDWRDADLYLDSWLMTPVLRAMLPEGSRILAFQDRFELQSVDAENMGAVEWIFPGHREPSASLPENTLLQKRMKAFLLAGGKPGWAKGRLKT